MEVTERAHDPQLGAPACADPGFGVYVHWPFCAQKCPYCDFNSHVRHGGIDEARFRAAYLTELAETRTLTGPREVASVFFGGGTPSLMSPATVCAILDEIARLWGIAPGAEITLEANPGSVEAGRFRGYRAAGVNRVSLGVQSLRDAELKRLGRIHSVAEAKDAIEIARTTFDRFSFDLIYARPGQSPADWRRELTEALSLAGEHLSLYQLTIEPETPFAALHAAGKLVVPDPDAALALYEITQELTETAGLPAYEISNHARPGAESRHNLLYWRYGLYAGIGPGAHGRLPSGTGLPSPTRGGAGGGGMPVALDEPGAPPFPTLPHIEPQARLRRDGGGSLDCRLASETHKLPERWLDAVEQHGQGRSALIPLAPAELADEMLLMGLRLAEGLDLDRLAEVGGLVPSERAISGLVSLGHLERLQSTRRVRATGQGRFVLNALVAALSNSFEVVAPLAAPQPAR